MIYLYRKLTGVDLGKAGWIFSEHDIGKKPDYETFKKYDTTLQLDHLIHSDVTTSNNFANRQH